MLTSREGAPRFAPVEAQTGDFELFFEKNKERLVLALWLITHSRDQAEEIAQDAFVKILERWERVSRLDNPEGYLFRAGINLARNRMRHAARAIRLQARPGPAPDELALVDAFDAATRALRRLPRSQRAAVVLVDVLAFTSEEAASAMGIRASTVRVHLARARKALRDQPRGEPDA